MSYSAVAPSPELWPGLGSWGTVFFLKDLYDLGCECRFTSWEWKTLVVKTEIYPLERPEAGLSEVYIGHLQPGMMGERRRLCLQ